MTVREVREELKKARDDDTVFVDDEPIVEIEIAVGDDGVYFWTAHFSTKKRTDRAS